MISANKLTLALLLSAATIACTPEPTNKTGTVAAPVHQKTGAPIALVSDKQYAAQPGDEVVLNLAIEARAARELSISLDADEGLALIAPLETTLATPTGPNTFELQVVARTPTAGRYYLRVLASAEIIGSRSFSIPIQVGPVVERVQAKTTGPGRENVRRMVAEETIP